MTSGDATRASLLLVLVLVLAGAACGSGGDDCPADDPRCAAEVCEASDECDDDEACNGVEACAAGVCAAGDDLPDRTACGGGSICWGGACVASSCGNAVVEPGEGCDDGNAEPLDGCDPACGFEVYFRSHARTLQASPAASFCAQPTSALGDALSTVALASTNSTTQTQIDDGIVNSILQLVALDDPSAVTDEAFEIRVSDAFLDPAGGAWPTDGSNPVDWPFRLDPRGVVDGEVADRIEDVSLEGGGFVGGPGGTTRPVPTLQDTTIRGHFDGADRPEVDGVADDLVVAREIIADGEDEGICGNLTVDALARTPADMTLAGCISCPGASNVYVPCPGNEVRPECNSLLDATVGGCIVFGDCATGVTVLFPTQPDIDKPGGVATLTPDPGDNFKIPASQTADNVDGYSVYFKFRARRVSVTGVAE